MQGRFILAVILGSISGGITVASIEAIGHMLFPIPPEVNASNPLAIEQYIRSAPMMALLFPLIGWVMGPFLAGFVSSLVWLKTSIVPSLVCGGILLAMTGVTLLSITHPLWMTIGGLVLPIPAAWLGYKVSIRI